MGLFKQRNKDLQTEKRQAANLPIVINEPYLYPYLKNLSKSFEMRKFCDIKDQSRSIPTLNILINVEDNKHFLYFPKSQVLVSSKVLPKTSKIHCELQISNLAEFPYCIFADGIKQKFFH